MQGKEKRIMVDKDGRRVVMSSTTDNIGGIPIKKPTPPSQPKTNVQPKVTTQPKVVTQKPTEPIENLSKPTKKHQKNQKKNKIWWLLVCVAVIIAAVIITIIILSQNKQPDAEVVETNDLPTVVQDVVTEEEEKITKEILEKYAEVTIDGYEKKEDGTNSSEIIKVSVKNISDEKTNLAIDVVAMDGNGNILDSSSLYAEGIEPEQTQTFELFSYSELTTEQLKEAEYKVHRARTYTIE